MGNLKNKLESLRSEMAAAAQRIVDEWQQDEEGIDEVYGAGGACDEVAHALIDIIQSKTDADAVCGSPDGEDHEWVAVSDGREAFVVDIPPGVYETGGGYSWKKIEGAEVTPQDIIIAEVPKEDLADLFEENYAQYCMYNMSSDGMTDELWQLAQDDANVWKSLGIGNDKERNLYFYLDNFYDDLCEEFGCKQDGAREAILASAFDELKGKEKVDLTDIRKSMYRAVREVSLNHKVAYPNVHLDDIRQPSQDVGKWVSTLNEIYAAVYQGESLGAATQRLTEGWNPMEKRKFENWKKFYDNGEHKKYVVAYQVKFPFTEGEEISFPEEAPPEVRKPGRPRRKTKTPDDIKRSLVSRLDSADKLLREFSGVWDSNVWNRLHSSLNDLKREVMMLSSASTARDVIIKTAGVWARDGFSEVADVLEKIAQPPAEGDVASEIEQALTGEREEKPAGGAAPDMGMEGMEGLEAPEGEMEMSPEDLDAPPAEAGEELPMPEAPVGEEEPAEVPEGLEETPESSDVDTEENPYVGSTISDVVEVLEPVVMQLKERAVARELAKIDMMLDAQNIASHFPELGEAMNKVLESNTYVVTRLDKLLTKIKGGVQEGQEEEKKEETGPEIDMGELTSPEADLEVSEEMAPAEPAAPKAPAAPEADLEVEEEVPTLEG